MVRRTVRLTGRESSVAQLSARFERVRRELQIPAEFPAEVLAAAAERAGRGPRAEDPDRVDLRAVDFVTVDPPGSTDLDQAMALRRRPEGGYLVDYAIADVPAFVPPRSPLDLTARSRGQTLYAPDRRIPLHPPVLSEDAASLLEGRDRPAFVWRFALTPEGEVARTELVRGVVRSRARLTYEQVQAAADARPRSGAAGPADGLDPVAGQAVLLREIGTARQRLEQARGGASLPLPEQQVDAVDGRYELRLRPTLPAEDWNAQLSLMTGMAAASIMLDGGVGLLRTLPPPDPSTLERFRRQASALGVRWPAGLAYGEFLRSLRRDVPRELALMHAAGGLFRGAGYTPLDAASGAGVPAVTTHAAVAAPYAHVTAPLRRLVDRFGLITCHALVHGRAVPGWVIEALGELPEAMRASDQLAGQLERRCTDLVEAAVLAHRVGQVFDAVVVDLGGRPGRSPVTAKVQLSEPAVLASVRVREGQEGQEGRVGQIRSGHRVRMRLEQVDPDQGTVSFVVEQVLAG
ncbi:MAG: RNB domain-containing ribonuclease [Kineosporiaceae bacterium]|nr:RNB domain-containing ribonuclease [Kineosporiaceae bacterium]